MRWATQGTIIATREALQHGLSVNLSGGYHHAKPNGGEGFCIYSDIAIAVHSMRDESLLAPDARVVYVDLDAHQGNGVCHAFRNETRVFIFDMYNSTIYPSYDTDAQARIDCDIRLTGNCSEGEYLAELKGKLPGFLDSVGESTPIGLAIYNAGTDVFKGDVLGGLNVSAEGIAERDAFVVDQLQQRRIPTVMLLSGGYSSVTYKHIADSVMNLIRAQSS
jgi:histone deacetylase 11